MVCTWLWTQSCYIFSEFYNRLIKRLFRVILLRFPWCSFFVYIEKLLFSSPLFHIDVENKNYEAILSSDLLNIIIGTLWVDGLVILLFIILFILTWLRIPELYYIFHLIWIYSSSSSLRLAGLSDHCSDQFVLKIFVQLSSVSHCAACDCVTRSALWWVSWHLTSHLSWCIVTYHDMVIISFVSPHRSPHGNQV